MDIDWKKIITNLFDHSDLTIEDVSSRTFIPKQKIDNLLDDKECNLKQTEARLLIRLHFRECGDLHNDIFTG